MAGAEGLPSGGPIKVGWLAGTAFALVLILLAAWGVEVERRNIRQDERATAIEEREAKDREEWSERLTRMETILEVIVKQGTAQLCGKGPT